MAYIGPEPNPGQNREVDDISSGFNGSEVNFTLQVNSQNVSPGSSNNIIVSLGGVVQNPGTDYTVAASTLTFTTAPASGLSFFGLVLGQQVDIQSVADSASIVSPTLSNPTVTGDLSIADKVVHTGDTNTAIRFPDADTITAETGGTERLRIASDGLITQKTGDLIIDQTNNGYGGLRIVDSSAGEYSVSYILGRNSGLSAHIFKYNGRTQNQSPWSNNGTGVEMGRWTATGIAFNGDTAAANSLDDYEEGSWTPNIRNDGTTANWSSQTGTYVKIGQQVTVWFNADGGSSPRSGGSSSSLIMTGLPFSQVIFGNPILGVVGANKASGTGLYSTSGLILNAFGQAGTQVRFGCGGQPINFEISYVAGCLTYTAAS
jgi:hypothetical protein